MINGRGPVGDGTWSRLSGVGFGAIINFIGLFSPDEAETQAWLAFTDERCLHRGRAVSAICRKNRPRPAPKSALVCILIEAGGGGGQR